MNTQRFHLLDAAALEVIALYLVVCLFLGLVIAVALNVR